MDVGTRSVLGVAGSREHCGEHAEACSRASRNHATSVRVGHDQPFHGALDVGALCVVVSSTESIGEAPRTTGLPDGQWRSDDVQDAANTEEYVFRRCQGDRDYPSAYGLQNGV